LHRHIRYEATKNEGYLTNKKFREIVATASLPALPALIHLDLRRNNINSLNDLSGLGRCPQLQALHLSSSTGNPGTYQQVLLPSFPCVPLFLAQVYTFTMHTVCSLGAYEEEVFAICPQLQELDGRHVAISKVRFAFQTLITCSRSHDSCSGTSRGTLSQRPTKWHLYLRAGSSRRARLAAVVAS
jgi:hypothetical protein